MADEDREHFDVCIFGCGSGGFAGAMRALDLGKHVCVIEADEIGGAGVMWGALSSKTMWELAKDYNIAAQTDRGYNSKDLSVNYDAVRASVIQAVEFKQQQMLSQLETYSPRRWPGPGSITYKRGHGTFHSETEAKITYADGREEIIEASNFLIATGSRPRTFPGIPVDQERIFDSDGILNLEAFPERLMIIGAGHHRVRIRHHFLQFRSDPGLPGRSCRADHPLRRRRHR